jgi:hydrogenase maturation protein HypF
VNGIPASFAAPALARRFLVRGIVQGVGFRPFVFRLAAHHGLTGWVMNGPHGVEIHAEGEHDALEAFESDLVGHAPPAAAISHIASWPARHAGSNAFEIRTSSIEGSPTTRVTPDLPVCDLCLQELFAPDDRRFLYPYINCTNCGPRYSIIQRLPYDRAHTTMARWTMCERCRREFDDVRDRRFHAQPIACPMCGPRYALESRDVPTAYGREAISNAAALLRRGAIVAVKGIGGFQLACDARNAEAVAALRLRKFRKERPFALMVRDVAAAQPIVELSAAEIRLLESKSRPIVLARACAWLEGVAPDNIDLGVMLPCAPIHALLFAAGAPDVLVMTSGNRSSEPMACTDDDARARLGGVTDAFLIGERAIARRVDDSVAVVGPSGPIVLRRARGLAPEVVAELPSRVPILAVGGDMKNAITLVVGGQAIVSQYVGDLVHAPCVEAFDEAIRDLMALYPVDPAELVVAHDAHPEYVSTTKALELVAKRHLAVQHHRAHIASVMAEHGELDTRVVGVVFDGTGYGDDGTIWGGEFFVGSVREGFERAAHLRPAALVGGDAAARLPAQAAAGFLLDVPDAANLGHPPFCLPVEYSRARRLASAGIRTCATTSAGRLFDTVAALVGYTRHVTFEGQAAMWLEHLGRRSRSLTAFVPHYSRRVIDYRPALCEILAARRHGTDPCTISRAFHRGLALAIAAAAVDLATERGIDTLVLSGGVFQNQLLLSDVFEAVLPHGARVLTNHDVPPNDGGVSLGQAAIAAASAY